MLRIRDVCHGSRILILFIQDPGSKNSNKREMGKKIFVIPLFVAINITKLKHILIFELVRKTWANLQLYNFLPQKLLISSRKYGLGSEIRDPGSGKKPILDRGSRGQKGTGSWIPDPVPQRWFFSSKFC
jgi:hypothetical protein